MASEQVSTKRCSRCKQQRPIGLFGSSGVDRRGIRRLYSWCKPCCKENRDKSKDMRRAATARWRAQNPEKSREAHDRWVRENPERIKAYQRQTLLRKYGLTLEQFDEKLAWQGGKCAVCFMPFGSTRQTMPYVDHCHTTGKTRDLLCIRCNSMIGHGRDDTDILLSAIEYLRRHRERAA